MEIKAEREIYITNCPLQEDIYRAFISGKNFARAIRRLRHGLRTCTACTAADACPVRKELNSQIDEAIRQVAAEWKQSQ
jgi:hypothetical protein